MVGSRAFNHKIRCVIINHITEINKVIAFAHMHIFSALFVIIW